MSPPTPASAPGVAGRPQPGETPFIRPKRRRSRPWERTGCGKRRQTPDRASRDYLRHSLPCCRSCTLLRADVAFPKPPSRPLNPPDLRSRSFCRHPRRFSPKKRRPSARRPVFPLPAEAQPTQSKKITAKACFPSPGVKTAAPDEPHDARVRCAARQ